MKIMAINAGSSSLKFSLFDMATEKVLISGLFERIGISNSGYKIKYQGNTLEELVKLNNHADAVKILLDKLLELKVINNLEEIDGIGHRIVHGGTEYTKSVLVDDKIIEDLDSISDLAPLHNPAHVLGIKAFKEVLPNTKMTVVFDTAFHQTMEKEQYLYAVPYRWYTDYKVRKYGFHGTSHRYISMTISEVLKRNDLKLITCHLGNGSSIAAIKDGKCFDTSMGFTPHAGVVMGTRSGDIDVTLIPYIMNKSNITLEDAINILNKESGYLGISGISSDNRDIQKGIDENNERCILARNMLVDSIVKYISYYYVMLDGVDVICFAGGIGENSPEVRSSVIKKLEVLGIKIDSEKNNVRGELREISDAYSKTKVYIVPTNEELMIARDTLELINS